MGMMKARSSGAVLLFKIRERKKAGMMRARSSGAALLFQKEERKKAAEWHYNIELLPSFGVTVIAMRQHKTRDLSIVST